MGIGNLAGQIKMIIFDVDGVLTDGKIVIGNSGEVLKEFNAQDGLGISLLRQNGIIPAIITGRTSGIVAQRAAELKIENLYQGAKDKTLALMELQEKHKLALSQIAYVGDDLIDLPVMLQVGLSFAVANAVLEVKDQANYVTKNYGGNGATIAKNCNISKQDGEYVYNKYFEAFPGLKNYFDLVLAKAEYFDYILFNNITGRKLFISLDEPFVKYKNLVKSPEFWYDPEAKNIMREYNKSKSEIQLNQFL